MTITIVGVGSIKPTGAGFAFDGWAFSGPGGSYDEYVKTILLHIAEKCHVKIVQKEYVPIKFINKEPDATGVFDNQSVPVV